MSANKLNQAQKLIVKIIISEQDLRERSLRDMQEAIKAQLGIMLSTVMIFEYKKQVYAEWQQQYLGNVDEKKGRELAFLAFCQKELLQEWERSKLDAETVTTESLIPEEDYQPPRKRKSKDRFFDSEDEDPRVPQKTIIKEQLKRTGQCADSSYMRTLVAVSKRRSELLGMDITSKEAIKSHDESEDFVKQIMAKYAERFNSLSSDLIQ